MKPGALRPLKLLRRWRDHDWRSRSFFVVAVGYLLASYCRYKLQSSAQILAELQTTLPPSRENQLFDWEKAVWAVAAASAHVPWRSDCLIQAMAASRWLRRHGYRPVFHLGAARSTEDGLIQAHAWLSLDGGVILGGDESSRFATFSAPAGAEQRTKGHVPGRQ